MAKVQINNVGIVLDTLGPSQLAYTSISSVNKYLANNYRESITLFSLEQDVPCLKVRTTCLNIADIVFFNGYIIATSYRSLREIIGTKAKLFYYINDIEYIRPNGPTKDEMRQLISDNNLQCFVRCQDHLSKLTSDGVINDAKVIENFDIETLLENINGP